MMRIATAFVAVWVTFVPSSVEATETGVDLGWVVANGELVDSFAAVDSIGVDWVRINFRLDVWSSPDDATPHGSQGLTWFQTYDRVIDDYVARGYRVYALINDEALGSSAAHGSAEWTADYVRNAVLIVDHFKDRIRVYEIINEPNDWAGGMEARFTPYEFARILQETYLEVKHHGGHIDDRCWQVDLVSGGLFSFDGSSAAEYLAATYAAGLDQLAWDWTRQATGSFPLDGIGYHMYVAQGPDSSLDDVHAGMHANLGTVWDVVAAHEGSATSKQFWVSEFGYRVDVLGEAEQASRLAAGFSAMKSTPRGNVALGLYFTTTDFPDNAWGVFDSGGNRRPSADRLGEVAAANRPPLGAGVTNVVTPELAAGSVGEVTVTLVNRGAQTWTAGTRLAAAPGCPDAATANELEWVPIDGYANRPDDARVFLPNDVAPGESITLVIPVLAHTPGTYRFAARMVEEGVAFFGATASTEVSVVQVSDGEGADDLDRDLDDVIDDTGGGCSTAGSSSMLLALGLLALRRRR